MNDLRRFLGILNFCRRFLPKAADLQLPLHSMLSAGKKKDKTPLTWTTESEKAFISSKQELESVTYLSHPDSSALIALMYVTLLWAIGASVQQQIGNNFEPLGFVSHKLSSAEQKYSTYDRALLAIFASIRYFRYLLEGREFTVFTDHKPLTHALTQNYDKLSPQQIN